MFLVQVQPLKVLNKIIEFSPLHIPMCVCVCKVSAGYERCADRISLHTVNIMKSYTEANTNTRGGRAPRSLLFFFFFFFIGLQVSGVCVIY